MDPRIVFGGAFALAFVLSSLGGLKTYFCCPRAVAISGMRLVRNLCSHAKVIQKMGNGLSGQRLGEKNRKM